MKRSHEEFSFTFSKQNLKQLFAQSGKQNITDKLCDLLEQYAQVDSQAVYSTTRSRRKIHHGCDIAAALTIFRQHDIPATNQAIRLMKLMLAVNQQSAQPIYKLPEDDIVRRICELGLTKENFFEIFANLNTFIMSPSQLAIAQQIGLLAFSPPKRRGLIALLGVRRLLQLLMKDPALVMLNLSDEELSDREDEETVPAALTLASILKNSPYVKELRFAYSIDSQIEENLDLFTELVSNTHLTAVTVSYEVYNEGAEILGQMTHLRSIDVSCTGIGEDGASALASLPNLQYLNLSSNAINDEGAAQFTTHPTLETLIISYNNVTLAGMKELLTNTRLTTLEMIGDDDVELRELEGSLNAMLARNRACYSVAAVIAATLRNAFYEVMVPLVIKDILSYVYPETDKFTSRIQRATRFVETVVKPRQLNEVSRRSALRVRSANEETATIPYTYFPVKDLTLNTMREALLAYIAAAESSVLIEGGQYAQEMKMALHFYPSDNHSSDTEVIRVLRLLLIMEGQLHCAIKQLSPHNPIRCLVQDVLLKLKLGELSRELLDVLLEGAAHLVTNAVTVHAIPVGKRKQLLKFMSESTMLRMLQQDEAVTHLELPNCELDSAEAETLTWLLTKSRRLKTVSIKPHPVALGQRFFGASRQEIAGDDVSERDLQRVANRG